MSNSFSLDDIRSAAEAKYGATVITLPDGYDVRLLNPIRMRSDKRAELIRIQKQINDAAPEEGAEVDEDKAVEQSEDQIKLLADAIRTVCETNAMADRLLDQIGDDGGLLLTVFEKYNASEQVGEA